MNTEDLIRERMTTMGYAMRRAGFSRNLNTLILAIAVYQNNGGDYAAALAALDAAYGMGSEGQSRIADKAKLSMPSTSQPDAAKGHSAVAEKAKWQVPDAAPQRDGAGHVISADKAIPPVPGSVSPKRKTRADRLKSGAAKASQEALSRSLFDIVKLPDGRSFGEAQHNELPAIGKQSMFVGRLAMRVYRHGIPADPTTKVRDFIKESDFRTAIEDVEKFNDIF